ncbi:MAG: hypothetical protein ABI167_11465 [Nitrosospira sp.]
MHQVKYIGTCIKTDSIKGIGLKWKPGQIRTVTAELAERLLPYSDTWVTEQLAKDEKANEAEDPIGLAQEEKPAEEPLPVVDFHAMDKKAMIEYADHHYNERLDKRQNEDAIRHRLIDLFVGHHLAEQA